MNKGSWNELSTMGKSLVMFPFLFCFLVFLMRISRSNVEGRDASYFIGAVMGYIFISSFASLLIFMFVRRKRKKG